MSANTKNGKVYGCHVDLGPNEDPDGCVIDFGAHADCIYAKTSTGRDRRSKWACHHWKPFKDAEPSQ